MPFFRWSSSLPASCWASVKVLLLVVHSPPGLLVNCPLSLPLFPGIASSLLLFAVQSSPPRFVGHLALLLLAELTFAVSTHIPLRSQREPVASVTCKRESVLFLDGKFVHIRFVSMVSSMMGL